MKRSEYESYAEKLTDDELIQKIKQIESLKYKSTNKCFLWVAYQNELNKRIKSF